MSQTTTLILFPQTTYDGGVSANVYTLIGNTQPAASYYLGNKDLQTVNISLSEVTGNIIIEASLSTDPTSIDWFQVYELEANNYSNTNSNASLYTNVSGNFVYMRAKVQDFAGGVVNFVKLSY